MDNDSRAHFLRWRLDDEKVEVLRKYLESHTVALKKQKHNLAGVSDSPAVLRNSNLLRFIERKRRTDCASYRRSSVGNPVTSCTKISPGCKNCYAERMALRLQAMGQQNYRNGFEVALQQHMLELPPR